MEDGTRRLLVRAREGDAEAREALLERLRPRLLLWASARLGPALRAECEPEDVVQEVLVAVHKGLDGFRGDDRRAFLGWIFAVGENRIRDLADRAGAEKRRLPTEARRATQTSPSQAAARAELAQRLGEAVARLAEPHRDVIRMRRFEEMDVAEIARAMGKSENAVRILYCRAIAELREAFGRP